MAALQRVFNDRGAAFSRTSLAPINSDASSLPSTPSFIARDVTAAVATAPPGSADAAPGAPQSAMYVAAAGSEQPAPDEAHYCQCGQLAGGADFE